MSADESTRESDYWREPTDFPGYRVSRDGRLQSRRSRRPLGQGNGSAVAMRDEWRDLKAILLPNGYLTARFRIDGRKYAVSKYVHRLVLELFVGPKPEGMEEVRHLNGVKTDNRVENLAWGTKKENWVDMRRHGTYPHGSRHGIAKLTEEKVMEILHLLTDGRTHSSISKLYGVCPATITFIAKRQTWVHVSEEYDRQCHAVSGS